MSIHIKHVSKNFGDFKALDSINIDIQTGELVALLGPSGSGKTSLLRIIAGLEHLDQGAILFDGKEITHVNPKERNVGFVFQHYALFRHMTVFDNVAYGLKVRPKKTRPSKADINKKVAELLQLVKLEPLANRYPSQLSGGQRQRVALARALAVEPKVLLLDEPFGALDNITRSAIHNEFKNLDELKNKTTILVTHDVVEAFELGHRICLMDQGKVVQIGSPAEILYHPVNDFVKDFFASNRLMLEYKIASVQSVESFLKKPLSLQAQKQLTKNTAIWEMLQILSTEKVYNEDYEALLQAFNQYRKLQTV